MNPLLSQLKLIQNKGFHYFYNIGKYLHFVHTFLIKYHLHRYHIQNFEIKELLHLLNKFLHLLHLFLGKLFYKDKMCLTIGNKYLKYLPNFYLNQHN